MNLQSTLNCGFVICVINICLASPLKRINCGIFFLILQDSDSDDDDDDDEDDSEIDLDADDQDDSGDDVVAPPNPRKRQPPQLDDSDNDF